MCKSSSGWCAILLNTPDPIPPIAEAFIIAADGGAKKGVRPSLWVGDGDSSLPPDGTERIGVPVEKDFTDGELALKVALERGWRKIRLYGVTGGRPDQELNNYSLIVSATLSGAEAEGIGDGVKIRYIRDRVTVTVKSDTVISIIPFGGAATVRAAKGLKYPLDPLTLHPEAMGRGVSNRAIDTTVRFEVNAGGVLLFVYDPEANFICD